MPQAQPGTSPSQLIASTRHEAGPSLHRTALESPSTQTAAEALELWLCDAAGSNLVQLTSFGGALVGTPRWAPDGRRLVFDVMANGNSDVHVIGVEGGLPRRVTTESFFEGFRAGRETAAGSTSPRIARGAPRSGKCPRQAGTRSRSQSTVDSQPSNRATASTSYYAKGLESDGVWKVAVSGGEEAEVIAFPKAGFWGYWALVDAGIYFVDTESRPQPALKFLNFARTQVEHIAGLEGAPVPFEPGIAVSPDGRWILYAQEDHRSGDIMLVENFH